MKKYQRIVLISFGILFVLLILLSGDLVAIIVYSFYGVLFFVLGMIVNILKKKAKQRGWEIRKIKRKINKFFEKIRYDI